MRQLGTARFRREEAMTKQAAKGNIKYKDDECKQVCSNSNANVDTERTQCRMANLEFRDESVRVKGGSKITLQPRASLLAYIDGWGLMLSLDVCAVLTNDKNGTTWKRVSLVEVAR